MSYPKRALAGLALVGLAGIGAVAVVADRPAEHPVSQPKPVDLGRIAPIALTTGHDCTDLLAYYRSNAERIAGPYGLGSDNGMLRVPGVMMKAEAAAGRVSDASAAPADTTTNVQVSGVDEGDVVKTSGDLMVSVVDNQVKITRLAGAKTAELATWRPAVGGVQSVLLQGTTAVIVGDDGEMPGGGIADFKRRVAPAFDNLTVLTALDLSDPAKPRPVRRIELDGSRAGDVRLVGGELRLALTAGPHGLNWKQPEPPPGDDLGGTVWEKAQKAATAQNRRIAARSTIGNWIPRITVTEYDADGKARAEGVRRPLIECSKIATPQTFSGLETLIMLSTDLTGDTPLDTERAAGVVAAGSTLYATADHAWLATSRWNAGWEGDIQMFRPDASRTQIHLFETPLGGEPEYVASGEVAGTLLNQFAMDERSGVLRVASTTEASIENNSTAIDLGTTTAGTEGTKPADPEATGASGAPADGVTTASTPAETEKATPKIVPSQSRITTLRPEGARLTGIGLLTGLGSGERIQGVRFIGDIGYVVTFRQTDPLYIVDLADPADPKLRGELKMTGYSAYLHPAGDGRLLGLGQAGTADGTTTGLQLSLFDVASPADPRRIATTGLDSAWSDAEGDHHAFTMAGDLALVPYTRWQTAKPGEGDGTFDTRYDGGVVAVRVEADGLGVPVTLRPLADGPITFRGDKQIKKADQRVMNAAPLRTLVHDGVIYTLTSAGVAAHDGGDFHRLTFARF